MRFGSEDRQEAVRSQYALAAGRGLSSERSDVEAVARAFGYTPEQLASTPATANLGLSCGNPIAFANLRCGETVVDLGSGGGLDVFLAARKVGPAGRAIGIDMTEEMVTLARRNAAKGADGMPFVNVEFHQAEIDQLPLCSSSVDCVISNCVINLAVDKRAVFREIARVLKPGGRLAVTDIALKAPLPAELVANLEAYVGCIAGAIALDEYRQGLRYAGFSSVEIVQTQSDLNVYAMIDNQSCCCPPTATGSENASDPCGLPPSVHRGLANLLARCDINDYAASVRVYAIKPVDGPNG
jgi:SAM-dependent methyltransferase